MFTHNGERLHICSNCYKSFGRAGHLRAAITHFREKEGKIPDHAPTKFLSAEERDVLNRDDGTFRPSLYKMFLFQHVTDTIKSGDLNLASSYKYRPMDAYLIDKDRWAQEKDHLLERAGLTEFADPGPVLEKLDAALTQGLRADNQVDLHPALHR